MFRVFLLTVIMIMFSTSAFAGWVKLGEAGEGDATFSYYANNSPHKKSKNIAKMWILKDYQTSQTAASSHPYLSVKALMEFDCTLYTQRLHS